MRPAPPAARTRRRRHPVPPVRRGPAILRVEIGDEVLGGIVVDGTPLSGADGVAGGLGHFVVPDRREALCWCGNRGCLTAVAGGVAMARQLGVAPGTAAVDGLLGLERSGDTAACAALRSAGWQIGRALRSCVTILDPVRIEVGGTLARSSSNLRWGITELYEDQPVPLCPLTHDDTDDVLRTSARRQQPDGDRRVAAAG